VLLASLTWLDQAGPISQRQLAHHARTDPMMTSQVIRALEKRGLVVRHAHPQDGRAFSLRATTAGAKLANRAIGAVEGVDKKFFGRLPDAGKRLSRDLNRLVP